MVASCLQPSHDQRGRLLVSTERLNQSGERIKESKRTLLETEELGVSILQDLHSQRQTLLHAQNTVRLTKASNFLMLMPMSVVDLKHGQTELCLIRKF